MATKCPEEEDGLHWVWSLGAPLAMCASHKHLAVHVLEKEGFPVVTCPSQAEMARPVPSPAGTMAHRVHRAQAPRGMWPQRERIRQG